jgi:steroid delta-isomerase-like uncharacterized protein
MTDTEQTRQAFDRIFDAIFHQRDPKAAAALYTEDATMWDPGETDLVQGRDAIQAYYTVYLTAFPDLDADLTNLIASGDRFAAELVISGTHTGTLESSPGVAIPATGRRWTLNVCFAGRITPDGRCADDRTYYDNASFLAQLGLDADTV